MKRHLLIVATAMLLGACSSMDKSPVADIETIEQQQQLDLQVSKNAHRALESLAELEQDNYVRYERAKQLYMIAMLEADWEANKQAQAIIEELLADEGFVRPAYRHAELRAYYGSLYTLKGRDMPGWWWVNNMTPVGFVRIYYMRKGVSELNAAVEQDAYHPVVRLIRGNTFTHLPAFAGVRQKGIADMQLLLGWLQDSRKNQAYESILQDRSFRLSAYFSIAQVLEQSGDRAQALQAYQAVTELAPDSIEASIAYSAIQRIHTLVKEDL